MLQRLRSAITSSQGKSLAGAFWRLGWAGFWLQVVFGSLSILGIGYYLAFAHPDARGGFGFMEVLTVIDLLILAFTTYWSYRYTRIGRKLRDPQQNLTESSLNKTVWKGVVATTVGILFSMIAILIETANLLFYFLKSPQAGIPVIQTSGAAASHWVSSVDMLSLMTLVLCLFAEMIVLVFNLWLLFRTSPPAG
jgi:hypothetical protein